jgi:hypothetical protein
MLPAVELSQSASSRGFQVTTPEQIKAVIDTASRGSNSAQTQAAENEQLRTSETIKEEVRNQFKTPPKPTELELFASLSAAKQSNQTLTPEQDFALKALQNKYRPRDKDKKGISSRTVTLDVGGSPVVHGLDQDTGQLVALEDETGRPAINESARRQREQSDRLERKEHRLVMKSLDQQYKDFAHKNRIFMDQAQAYNALVLDNESTDQSVEDKVLSMAFIRRIKPTGTISSNFDLNSVDALRSFPEAIKVGIQGIIKDGKVLPDRVRKSMIKFVTKEFNIAKAREEAVISNAKTRARQLEQEWTPPIFIPGDSGIEEVKDEDISSFDSDDSNFEGFSIVE